MTDDSEGVPGDAPPPWQPPTGEQLFHVWFGGRGIVGVRYRTGALPMLGKGELRIGPDGLAFRGRNQQLVGKRDSVRRFSFDEIKDVYVDGLVVDFTIPPRTGEAHRVRFEAATEERAEAIAALLPQDISPETDAVIEELVEFHERLDAVSPHGYVVPVLLALNVLVFVAMAFGGAGVFEANGEVAVRWGSNFGPLTTGGEWWRLLSSTFIHFGIMHLALNMFALWQTGETVERLYGSARFLALYVCAGLAGSLASLLWHPVINSAGASGAIFGVFGGLLAFVVTPGSRVPRMVMLEHRNSTLLFAGYSLFYGAVHPGIDNAAHIGGLVSGFLVGLLLARPVDPAARARPAGARLALTAVGAVLVLLAMAWGSLHLPGTRQGEREYARFELALGAREQAALVPLNESAKHVGADGDMASYKRLVKESGVLWAALVADLRAITLAPDSPRAPRQAALLRYLEARERFCRLALLAADGDPEAIRDVPKTMDDANAALEQLKTL